MARRNSILVSRSLYQIGVITLFASILWVAVGVYTATNTVIIQDVDKTILEPLNPTLDQQVIKSLSDRLKIEVDSSTNATASASPSASIEEGITE